MDGDCSSHRTHSRRNRLLAGHDRGHCGLRGCAASPDTLASVLVLLHRHHPLLPFSAPAFSFFAACHAIESHVSVSFRDCRRKSLVSPVLKPNLNTSWRHTDLIRQHFARHRARLAIFVKRLFQDGQLLRRCAFPMLDLDNAQRQRWSRIVRVSQQRVAYLVRVVHRAMMKLIMEIEADVCTVAAILGNAMLLMRAQIPPKTASPEAACVHPVLCGTTLNGRVVLLPQRYRGSDRMRKRMVRQGWSIDWICSLKLCWCAVRCWRLLSIMVAIRVDPGLSERHHLALLIQGGRRGRSSSHVVHPRHPYIILTGKSRSSVMGRMRSRRGRGHGIDVRFVSIRAARTAVRTGVGMVRGVRHQGWLTRMNRDSRHVQ